MQIIGAQLCSNCKFSFREPGVSGAVLCRRFPKQGGPIVVPIKAGVLQVQMHFGYPVQMDDETCGEWKPRLAIAASEVVGRVPQLPKPSADSEPLDLKKYLDAQKAVA
jgi:hypothetical protein